jgi:hypothetical protein
MKKFSASWVVCMYPSRLGSAYNYSYQPYHNSSSLVGAASNSRRSPVEHEDCGRTSSHVPRTVRLSIHHRRLRTTTPAHWTSLLHHHATTLPHLETTKPTHQATISTHQAPLQRLHVVFPLYIHFHLTCTSTSNVDLPIFCKGHLLTTNKQHLGILGTHSEPGLT